MVEDMAQLEPGLPSVPAASLMPDGGHEMRPEQQPASATQRRFAFDFDVRYLSRVLRDYKAEQLAHAPGQQQPSVEPDGQCTPDLDLTPEQGSDEQQQQIGWPKQGSGQSSILPSPGPNSSPCPPMQEFDQLGGQVPVIPPTVATPCNVDKVPAEPSEVHFVSYYTAPPRIQVNSATRPPVQGNSGSIEVSMQPEQSQAAPATPVAEQPFKLSAQTPIGGVPECHYSAMRSRSAPPKSPSPPPTPMEGVPELHDSAIAPVVAAKRVPSTPSPVAPTEVKSPLCALEGVPEAHASAWAPPPRPRVPTPLSPRQALHDRANVNETQDTPGSPVLEQGPCAMATASHSFRVPDHPVLLRSNPSPLPLTPRSQLIAESHQAPSPVPAPQELANKPSPEQASQSAASISLSAGNGPGEAPHSVHAASPQPELNVGRRQVHAATSPMSPMPWFATAADLAPPGHVSVAVGTTPAHEGGFGAHTMAGGVALGQGLMPPAGAAARGAMQSQQVTSSGEGRVTRTRTQLDAQRGSDAGSMHPSASMHGGGEAGQHSRAGGQAVGGSKDAVTGSGSEPAAGTDAGHPASHACADHGQAAAQPQPDDLWFGPDDDDAMGSLDSDDDIPEDPCATPPSEKRRAAAASKDRRPDGPSDAPVLDLGHDASLADMAGGSSGLQDDRVTPRLPQGSLSAGSQALGRASGKDPTPLTTGGMRAVANMLGWDGREANLRDHAMPELWPQMPDAAAGNSDRENVPSNVPSEGADRGNDSHSTQARSRQAEKEQHPPRVSALQKRFRKRKSLAESGLAERDGRRYSTRKRMAPLRWYCNEKKEYERKHSSLPTVAVVQRTDQRTSAYAGWKAGYHCDS